MFMNVLYLFAASTTIFISLLLLANGDLGNAVKHVANIPLGERTSMMMLVGVSTAVGFYVS